MRAASPSIDLGRPEIRAPSPSIDFGRPETEVVVPMTSFLERRIRDCRRWSGISEQGMVIAGRAIEEIDRLT
jgi:hypothetical protein